MIDQQEPADRNKSELTHKITRATQLWLENHGFKPVEAEVSLPHSGERSWVADIAAVISPTKTELIEMKMLPRPPRSMYEKNNTSYDVKRAAWEALYKPIDRGMTCLVEVKATRADFRGDRKWKLTPPTDLAYLALVPGIAKQEEWPAGWGILELRGSVVAQIRTPTPRITTLVEQFAVVYQLAIRCDHRTRYAAARVSNKAYRREQAKTESMDRIDNVVAAVHDIAAGHLRWSDEPLKSVEEALKRHGVKHASAANIERLSELFGIAARTEGK